MIGNAIRNTRKPDFTWWMVIAGAIIAAGFGLAGYAGATDNDMWWLFANGHAILENGFPYTSPFSIHENQGIVIQQWLPSVIAYVLWENGGALALGVFVFIQVMLLWASAVLFAYVAGNGKRLGIYSVLAGVLVAGCMAYVSIRPHLYSMIAYMLVLTVMEKYRQTGKIHWLYWLPPIVLVHANMHLSMMPLDFFLVGLYLLPQIPRKMCAEYDYRRLPIILTLFAMALASLINPYGLDGVLYLVNSYGAASYRDYISEMGATNTWVWYGFFCIVWIMLGSLGIGINGDKKVDWALTIFFIICVYVSLQHTRNVWLVSMAGYVLLVCAIARSTSQWSFPSWLHDDIVKVAITALGFIVLLPIGFSYGYDELTEPYEDSTRTPMEAVAYMESHESDISKLKVFAHFNAGGYLEYRGFKVGMDARPELWQSRITGLDKDYYTEYVDMSKDDITIEDYLADKDYDYLVVNTDTRMYRQLKDIFNYNIVVEGEEYVLFEAPDRS